jgi:predicted RNA binding protein YcfA (HicA-like mRNA interferase family)
MNKNVWDQLKSISADELIRALVRDGWVCEQRGGSQQLFYKSGRRVSVHFHPGKTYGPKLLKALFVDIGWGEEDFRRLKIIR